MNGEPAYQFVDTNVLVYAHDKSADQKHAQAKKLIQELWLSGSGCLSVQVLQEFYVTVTKKVAQPMAVDSAIGVISDLAFWRMHPPTAHDVLMAIDLQRRCSISFWDAMIIWSAAQLGCTVIWSEDLNPGQLYEGVKIRNPFSQE